MNEPFQVHSKKANYCRWKPHPEVLNQDDAARHDHTSPHQELQDTAEGGRIRLALAEVRPENAMKFDLVDYGKTLHPKRSCLGVSAELCEVKGEQS